MTMKTKRTLAVSGGTVFCAALIALIAARFAPEPEAAAPVTSDTNTTSSVNLTINAEIHEQKPIENKAETSDTTDNGTANSTPTEIDPEKEAAEFIESGGIEVRQDFDKPETTDGTQNTTSKTENTAPTEVPKVTNESQLTDSSKEPTYDPKDTVITPTENTGSEKINSEMHGQKKDGMIFITGFGWVKDEGGGGEGEYLEGMYENGNKIGYFG
ncbi:MAG: hypothetical protein NC401_19250 [Ruminococcus sp.]|nr:hypothetical protein [Ruminococcus sp.]